MESTKALREQRGKLIAEARQILDKASAEKRELDAAEQERFDKAHVDERALKAKIDRLESQEQAEADLKATITGKPGTEPVNGKTDREKEADAEAAKAPTAEDEALAFQGWLRRQTGREVTDEQRTAIKKCGVNPKSSEYGLGLGRDYRKVRQQARMAAAMTGANEARALSAQLQTGGEYTIPEGFVNNLEMALLAYADVRAVADVMRTESGQDLPWPTVNDTTQKATFIAENTTVSEKDITFGQIIFHAYKSTSGVVLIPAELLEDSAFNLGNFVGEAFGIRFGRLQADAFTTGTGASTPTGIVTASTLGVTFASDTAIQADELYTLKHSVDPAYRKGAGWMFHDQTLLFIKKLKDGLGRYLWQASLANGAPDTLDGDPITINQSMAQIGTTLFKTVLYGQFKKYKVREVNQMRVRRLEERYADSDQIGMIGFLRFDGNLLDAGTHPVKYGQHP